MKSVSKATLRKSPLEAKEQEMPFFLPVASRQAGSHTCVPVFDLRCSLCSGLWTARSFHAG